MSKQLGIVFTNLYNIYVNLESFKTQFSFGAHHTTSHSSIHPSINPCLAFNLITREISGKISIRDSIPYFANKILAKVF